jgi:hypothetical protein
VSLCVCVPNQNPQTIMSLEKAQRIVKDPNNLLWSRDSSRFGYQMLKQMGWKDGGGLGRTEDGSASHIRVDHKVDMGGIGAGKEEKRILTSTHTPAFEASLARLQQLYSAPAQLKSLVSEPHEEAGKGVFIGRMVRHRRAVDSKMVSNYSQKHLDEIFGRKREVVSTVDESDDSMASEGSEKEPSTVMRDEIFGRKREVVSTVDESDDSMASEGSEKEPSTVMRKAGSIDDFFRKRGRLALEHSETKDDVESLSCGKPKSDDESEKRRARKKKEKKVKRRKITQ